MTLPVSRNTTYVASTTPAIKAADLNDFQDEIISLNRRNEVRENWLEFLGTLSTTEQPLVVLPRWNFIRIGASTGSLIHQAPTNIYRNNSLILRQPSALNIADQFYSNIALWLNSTVNTQLDVDIAVSALDVAHTQVRYIGLSDSPTILPTTNNFIGFTNNSASNTNWHVIVVDEGLTVYDNDTGIAPATSFSGASLRFTITGAGTVPGQVINFYIGNSLVGTTPLFPTVSDGPLSYVFHNLNDAASTTMDTIIGAFLASWNR